MMMNTRFVRSEQMRKTVSLEGDVSVALSGQDCVGLT
jgi:hypothetical protein